jgi:hypothetical protein
MDAFIEGMKALGLALLLSLGCSAAGADVSPDVSVGGLLTITADPAVQVDVDAAVDLWARATDGAVLLRGSHLTVLLVDDFQGCAGLGSVAGCTSGSRVEISSRVASDHRVSTIAHEIGHTLGLLDMADGLMNPYRVGVERTDPCVSVDLAVAVGMPGPGACLTDPR